MEKEMKELKNINMKSLFIPGKKKTDTLEVGVIGAGKMGLLHDGFFNNLNGNILHTISKRTLWK